MLPRIPVDVIVEHIMPHCVRRPGDVLTWMLVCKKSRAALQAPSPAWHVLEEHLQELREELLYLVGRVPNMTRSFLARLERYYVLRPAWLLERGGVPLLLGSKRFMASQHHAHREQWASRREETQDQPGAVHRMLEARCSEDTYGCFVYCGLEWLSEGVFCGGNHVGGTRYTSTSYYEGPLVYVEGSGSRFDGVGELRRLDSDNWDSAVFRGRWVSGKPDGEFHVCLGGREFSGVLCKAVGDKYYRMPDDLLILSSTLDASRLLIRSVCPRTGAASHFDMQSATWVQGEGPSFERD